MTRIHVGLEHPNKVRGGPAAIYHKSSNNKCKLGAPVRVYSDS